MSGLSCGRIVTGTPASATQPSDVIPVSRTTYHLITSH